MQQQNEALRDLSFTSIWNAVLRRKYWIIAPTIVLGAALATYATMLPNVYRAEAFLTAEPMATAQDFVEAAGTSHTPHVLNVNEQMRAVRDTVMREAVLEKIVREFGIFPQVDGKIPDPLLRQLRDRIVVRAEGTEEMRHSNPKLVSFYVGFEGKDPEQVAKVANRLAVLFIEAAASDRARRVQEVEGFIDGELEPLRAKLAEQSEKIRGYKQGAVQELPEQATTNLRLLESTQIQYNSKVADIANEEARRMSVQEELRSLEKQGPIEPDLQREKHPVEVRLEERKLKLKELRAKYTEIWPEIARTEKEIGDLERLLPTLPKPQRAEASPLYLRYTQLKSELEGIESRLKSARREQQQLSAQMDAYRGRVASAPSHEKALTDLSRDFAATQTQYQHLLDKQQEARLAKGFEKLSKEVVFKIVEPARLPAEPASPQRARLILLGIFSGLGLGIVASFLIEQMDTAFEDVDAVQRYSPLPVIATIPSIRGGRGGGRSESWPTRVVAFHDPVSVAAEQYRLLGLRLYEAAPGTARVLAVMSSAGGEGKTMTAVNVAAALSGSVDARVLLVDADLRRPKVHEYVGLDADAGPGFAELLVNPPDDVMPHIRKVQNLYVLRGSAHCSNPVASLASPKARALMDQLRRNFGFIVLDCPPVLPIADSFLLAGLADRVLYIVRARLTRREVFQRAIENLSPSILAGIVVNDIDYRRTRYGYAYEYYQRHYLARQ